MRHDVGDLVWIPENTTLVWLLQHDRVIKKIMTTDRPSVALVVSHFDESRLMILREDDYWIINKIDTYEVPNVFDTRCSK